MSSNYPEGSMRGSGIYAEEVSYDAYTCDNTEECGYDNEAGEVSTDDWGNYEVVCDYCGATHLSGNKSDKDDEEEFYSDDNYQEFDDEF